jgi:hypothetical protein
VAISAKMGGIKHVKVEWPATSNSGAAHEILKGFVQLELRLPDRVRLEVPTSVEVLEPCKLALARNGRCYSSWQDI